MVTHNPIVEDSSMNQAALSYRHKNIGIAFGFNSVAHSGIDGRDINGFPQGEF